MSRDWCDGPALVRAFEVAVAHLEANAEEVNRLNVFPVPDGDTGSNMLATVRASLEEARALQEPEPTAGRVAEAVGFGALMGARGNSGVILSQIFRGMATGLAGKRRFNGLDLAHALTSGRDAAYAAVVRPVEGTILTVITDVAAAAVVAAEKDPDIEGVVTAAVEAAERSVARTPSLLPILREAGVVDAGGQGLYRILQGALLHLIDAAPAVAPSAAAAPRRASLVAHADEGFGYETMFLVTAEQSPLDLDAMRARLEALGESVLVAGDARAAKVHVHNERPDLVLGYGLTLGHVSHVAVTNLDDQARDVREARAAEFTAPGPGAGASDAPGDVSPPSRFVASEEPRGPAVIAVAAGDGLVRVLESFGVHAVVRGGQAANPSTGEIVAALKTAPGTDAIILPNNPNVKLAAEQAAALCPERRVVVIPTRNVAEGVAALLSLDPNLDAAGNAPAMQRAARSIQTLVATEAVRDARISGTRVKKGHTIALDPDEGLLAADRDPIRAVAAGVARFDPGFELITVYYGDTADLASAEALSQVLTAQHPGVEVEIHHGGQPYYSYLVAAE